MMNTVVALLATVATVSAVSSGAIDICNALSTLYGCDDFKDGLRSECQEENRIMQWTTKPVVAEDLFKIWVGEDEANPETTYVPGQWMKVNIRALKYDSQYRGLLMYGIDAKDEPEGYPNHTRGDPTKLGKWEFTDRQPTFHSHCPRTVCHSDGGLKAYHTSFRYQVPEDFDGQVQFVALIKVGPANMGEFYYPNKVVLSKANVEPKAPGAKWYKGRVGESCAEVCQREEMLCDGDRIGTVDSVSSLEQNVLTDLTCNKPPLLRCGALDLSQGEDGFCYYSNEQLCTAQSIPISEEKATCASKSDDPQVGARLCPCKCDGTKGPCFVPTEPPTQPPTKPPTQPPTQAPVIATPPPGKTCTGAAGGCCLADGTCQGSNTECKLLGGQATCVRKTICVYGDAGCPCTLQSSQCARGLSCSNGVCAVSSAPPSMPGQPSSGNGGQDYCAERIGQAGCWCTPAGGCVDANLVPKANNEGQCYCAVNLGANAGNGGPIEGVCERGDLGCPCLQSSCKEDGVCKKVGSNTLCLLDDSAPATALTAPLMAIVMLAIAQLF